MEENLKDKEVIEPKTIKPRKVKQVEKHTFLMDLGTDENGEIRYKKGQSYELTKKQVETYKKNKIICQH